jgi:hypothetical protein
MKTNEKETLSVLSKTLFDTSQTVPRSNDYFQRYQMGGFCGDYGIECESTTDEDSGCGCKVRPSTRARNQWMEGHHDDTVGFRERRTTSGGMSHPKWVTDTQARLAFPAPSKTMLSLQELRWTNRFSQVPVISTYDSWKTNDKSSSTSSRSC